jgi:hypothetical protein
VDYLIICHEVRSTSIKILIGQIFMEPLLANPPVATQTIHDIFSNIRFILTVHQQLLENLEQKMSTWSCHTRIGDVFLARVKYHIVFLTSSTVPRFHACIYSVCKEFQHLFGFFCKGSGNPSFCKFHGKTKDSSKVQYARTSRLCEKFSWIFDFLS